MKFLFLFFMISVSFLKFFRFKFISLVVLELIFIFFLIIFYLNYSDSGFLLFFMVYLVLDSVVLLVFFLSLVRSVSMLSFNFYNY